MNTADYMEYGIMSIDVKTHAQEDLDEIWGSDPEAAATITVVLEELDADSEVIDKLTTHGDNTVGDDLINVKAWEKLKRRANLWRFRILDTPATNYRIIYGYHWQTRQLCILAVVNKEDFNYDDSNSKIARRIIADWESL